MKTAVQNRLRSDIIDFPTHQRPYPPHCGSVPTDIYGVEGIPHLMLIGPDGTILKRGFHGAEGIRAAVEEYIK